MKRKPRAALAEELGLVALMDKRDLPFVRYYSTALPDDALVLPCPFCGGEELCLTVWIKSQAFLVACEECEGAGPTKYPFDEAIRAWNKAARG